MYKLTLLIITFLTLSGCVATKPDKIPSAGQNTSQSMEVKNQPLDQKSEVVKTLNPVSIEAIIQKDIAGSNLEIGKVLLQNSEYTRYYITYKSGDLKISGIMNVPKGQGPFPLLILNHGYIDPAIYTNGRGLKREQDCLAKRGYVVLHTDYRNHANSDNDANTETRFRLGYSEDAINAVNAILSADLSFVDKEKVGMLGHSVGGGVTLNTLVIRPDLVDAAVLFAPVSADYRKNHEKWTKNRTEVYQEITEKYGSPTTSPEFWEGISAKNYFDRIKAPIQIHHGTNDESVPLEWSDELASWLDKDDVTYEYFVYENEFHEFINAWPTVMSRVADFFDQHLK